MRAPQLKRKNKIKMLLSKMLFAYAVLVRCAIWCRVYEECQGIDEPDVVVASRESCAKYIFCDGKHSYEGECLAGNYFNENIGSCDDPIYVKCNIKPSDDIKSIYDEVKDKVVEETIGSSKYNKNITTEQTGSDVATKAHVCKCAQLNGSQSFKNIANAESCVAFYTCYNGQAIPMLCPSRMYFNENSSKCETKMPDSCTAKYSVRLNCHKGVYDFVPHPYRCQYYFYCLDGFLMIMRCPHGYTWHFERGTCVQKSKSKCYSDKSVRHRNDY